MDRLAIAGVFIAGTVEAAQAALANAPAVQRQYPVLKLDGLWQYAPAIFIGLSAFLWLADQALRIFRPSYAQARSVPVSVGASQPKRPEVPWRQIGTVLGWIIAIGAIGAGGVGLVRCSAEARRHEAQEVAAKPQMKFAPVLRGAVTLAFVRQTLASQDAVAAEKTLSSYLGTPMRVSGTVHSNEPSTEYARVVSLTDPKASPQVYLVFGRDHYSGVIGYEAGAHIAAECKVERLDANGIGLDGCALIPDEAWTGKPEA